MKKTYRKFEFLAKCIIVRRFQMPLEELAVETLATIGIINVKDSLIQNTTRIYCLRLLMFDILS